MSRERFFYDGFVNEVRYCSHPDYSDFMGYRIDIVLCFWLNNEFTSVNLPWFAGLEGPKHKYGAMIRETHGALIGLFESLDMSPPPDFDWLKWKPFRVAFGMRDYRMIRPKFYAPRWD